MENQALHTQAEFDEDLTVYRITEVLSLKANSETLQDILTEVKTITLDKELIAKAFANYLNIKLVRS